MMSKSTYNNIVGPVLKDKDLWYVEREKNLNPLKNSREPIWLGGDGQFDSPGFSAKYIIYSTMDPHSGLIIDFELLQKDVIKGEPEKAACQKLLNKLITQEHCNIELFLNDRHKGVRFFLKTHYPNV
jgi:hypothetical protein